MLRIFIMVNYKPLVLLMWEQKNWVKKAWDFKPRTETILFFIRDGKTISIM